MAGSSRFCHETGKQQIAVRVGKELKGWGSARVSRVGEAVPASRTSLNRANTEHRTPNVERRIKKYPVDITLNVARRDPSTSLGMTGVG